MPGVASLGGPQELVLAETGGGLTGLVCSQVWGEWGEGGMLKFCTFTHLHCKRGFCNLHM